MKILFLTDNFPPEFNAPATRTYEHCKQWVRKGAEVTVITCFPNFPGGKVYPGYRNQWKKVEKMDGIKVIRVWTFVSANKGIFKRSLDFFSFAVMSFFSGLSVKCDVIIATSPQFFTAISGCMLGFFKGRKWVFEVRDIWPESIKAVEAFTARSVISLLEKIELFLYKRAHKVVVVTDSFKTNLTERGVRQDKVFVIKNGVDLSVYQPRQKDASLLEELGLSDKFVVGYIGTHGLAHGLDFILQSIAKIDDKSFHFLFIGDGAEKQKLISMANDLRLDCATFIDSVKKSEIASYIALLDVSLVPLRRSVTFESVIPSKMFESVAMTVPILLGVNGEAREIVEGYHAGLYYEPENQEDFLQKLRLFRSTVERNPAHFVQGCKKMATDFDRQLLAQQMLAVVTS